jgi:hypothetical protein
MAATGWILRETVSREREPYFTFGSRALLAAINLGLCNPPAKPILLRRQSQTVYQTLVVRWKPVAITHPVEFLSSEVEFINLVLRSTVFESSFGGSRV